MTNARFIARAGVALLALVVCAAPALAQRPRPDRPYRGLFGGNGADPNSTQALDVNVSLFGGYDDNVLAATPQGGIDPRFQKSGNYEGGTISLDYTRKAGRATFDFTGGTSYNYYPAISQMNGTDSFASVGVSAKLSPRTSFRATESASYLPFYSLGAIPGLTTAPGGVAPITSDYPLAQDSALAFSSSASLDHSVTSRSSLSADYRVQFTTYRASDRKYDTWAAGGGYSYKLSSRTSMRLAYHYSNYDNTVSGVNQPTESHDLTIGIDSTRQLSPSRTMTFGFNVGTSVYRSPASSGTPGDVMSPYQNRFLVTADAHLTRQISRSWSGNLAYNRGIQYVQGFPGPFFSDSVSAGLGGFLSPRSRLNLSASYSNGQVGVATTGQGYKTYWGWPATSLRSTGSSRSRLVITTTTTSSTRPWCCRQGWTVV